MSEPTRVRSVKLVRPVRSRRRPSATVVVPCYNYGRYLPDLVESVLRQEHVHVRVIIVEDSSTDDSGAVAERLAAADSRVCVVHHARNMGHIATYNDGLNRVTSDYVTLVSADDMLTPGALARATDVMEAYPSVGMVYGLTRSFTEKVPAFTQRRAPWTVWPGHKWISASCRLGRNFIMSPEVVMRTAALREVGGYNAALPHSADLELWLRVATAWDVGRVNGAVQAFYRVHEANMHLTTFATMPVDLRHRRAAFDVLGKEWSRERLPDADAYHQRAYAALARQATALADRELNVGASVDAVVALSDFAHETRSDGASVRRAVMLRKLARARRGAPPTGMQTAVENVRRQADRVRWKVWNSVGLS